MPKHKTSLLITVECDKPIGASKVSNMVRKVLSGQKIHIGEAGKREVITVKRAAVSHGGEK